MRLKERKGLMLGALCGASAMFLVGQANASFISEVNDLSGAISDGTLANPGQVTTVNIDAAPGINVINFQWVLVFEAFAPSWGSEARILIEAPDGASFTFAGSTDGGWASSPGLFFSEGSTDAFNGSPLGGDWTFTFYESFDDGISPDGTYLAAVFVITAVPAPAVLPLLAIGALVGTRRRRQ